MRVIDSTLAEIWGFETGQRKSGEWRIIPSSSSSSILLILLLAPRLRVPFFLSFYACFSF